MLPEWYAVWIEHYGESSTPMIVPTFGPDGELLGLMPLVIDQRKVRFAGASLGDHFAPVAAEGSEDAVAASVARELARAGYAVLDHVDTNASWVRAVQAASRRSLRQVGLRREVLPFIDLTDQSWDQYLASRSRNLRSQVRRKTRKLEREHAAVFRRTTSASELDADLDSFFALHDARWRPRGGSTLSSERSREFHRAFAAALLERGSLRLWFLELEGRTVAAWYGWNVGGRYGYYLGGFLPDAEPLSVGFVLLAHTIKAATEEGAYEYDLLRGDEDYKFRFSTGTRDVETVVLVPAGSLARVVVSTEAKLWELSQRMPDRARSVGQRLYSVLSGAAPTGSDR